MKQTILAFLVLLFILINGLQARSWVRLIRIAPQHLVLEYQQPYITRYDNTGTQRFDVTQLMAIMGGAQAPANRNQANQPQANDVITDRISQQNNTAANVQAMFLACTGNFVNQNGNNTITPQQLQQCFRNVEPQL